jgi:hypothetical protein
MNFVDAEVSPHPNPLPDGEGELNPGLNERPGLVSTSQSIGAAYISAADQ